MRMYFYMFLYKKNIILRECEGEDSLYEIFGFLVVYMLCN